MSTDTARKAARKIDGPVSGALSVAACGLVRGGGGGQGAATQTKSLRPQASWSIAGHTARGAGGCLTEQGEGNGGEPYSAGGTWGRSVEEWARSGGAAG